MSAGPIITLTTDFGLSDSFVGVMKGVIAGIAPHARVIDLTHGIPPQNVAAAAWVLHDSIPFFPEGTIHVAVVDPGVGSDRNPVAMESKGHLFVGPDNGIFTPFLPPARAAALSREDLCLRGISKTFHGRDLFAPVAARMAAGMDLMELGEKIDKLQRVVFPQVERMGNHYLAQVILVDRFGNLITNLAGSELPSGKVLTVRVKGRDIKGLSEYYAQGQDGELIALINSAGRIEVAKVNGSAAETLKAGIGTEVLVYSY